MDDSGKPCLRHKIDYNFGGSTKHMVMYYINYSKPGAQAFIVGDDFYSGGNDDAWSGCSAQEKVEKYIDWQRIRAQMLEPLLAHQPAFWHPLDFEPEIGWVGWKDETITPNCVLLQSVS